MAKSRGRPPKAVGERKDSHVIVRVDASDRTEFEKAAETAELSLSEWMRDRLRMAVKREKSRATSKQ